MISKSGVSGEYYLHVRVNTGGSYYYGSRLFKFDNVPPIIDLKGDNPTILSYKSIYVEKGVEHSDTYDLWPKYIGPDLSTIDSDTLGSYILNYIAEDSSGNQTKISRTVKVEDVISPVVTLVNFSIDEDNTLILND